MKKIFSLYSIKIYQPVKFYNKEKTDFLIKDLTNKENKCACIFCLWGTVMWNKIVELHLQSAVTMHFLALCTSIPTALHWKWLSVHVGKTQKRAISLNYWPGINFKFSLPIFWCMCLMFWKQQSCARGLYHCYIGAWQIILSLSPSTNCPEKPEPRFVLHILLHKRWDKSKLRISMSEVKFLIKSY